MKEQILSNMHMWFNMGTGISMFLMVLFFIYAPFAIKQEADGEEPKDPLYLIVIIWGILALIITLGVGCFYKSLI